MLALPFEPDDLFLGQKRVAAVGGHLIQFLKALDGFLYGDPVGQQSTQPALVDVEHAAAVSLYGNRVLGLPLGADKQDDLALPRQISDVLAGFLEHLQGLLQFNDVNPVALTEDVFLHSGIPTLGLMPEVNTRFEQLLHRNSGQTTSS